MSGCTPLSQLISTNLLKLQSNTSGFDNGEVASLQCLSGYDLKGPDVVTCVLGKWSPSLPSCTAKRSPSGLSTDQTVIIVICAIASLIALIVILAMCFICCKKSKEEEPSIPEKQQPPAGQTNPVMDWVQKSDPKASGADEEDNVGMPPVHLSTLSPALKGKKDGADEEDLDLDNVGMPPVHLSSMSPGLKGKQETVDESDIQFR